MGFSLISSASVTCTEIVSSGPSTYCARADPSGRNAGCAKADSANSVIATANDTLYVAIAVPRCYVSRRRLPFESHAQALDFHIQGLDLDLQHLDYCFELIARPGLIVWP